MRFLGKFSGRIFLIFPIKNVQVSELQTVDSEPHFISCVSRALILDKPHKNFDSTISYNADGVIAVIDFDSTLGIMTNENKCYQKN